MLYDPKWEKTETKADPLTTKALIAWLEQQPADKEYCYTEPGSCLLAQYLHHVFGFEVLIDRHSFDLFDGDNHVVRSAAPPTDWADIAIARPRTFGAALERARKLAA